MSKFKKGSVLFITLLSLYCFPFNSFAYYPNLPKNHHVDASDSKVVEISVTYNWRTNLDNTIESYSISNFSIYIYDASYVFI